MITSSNTMALYNHYATALGHRLGLGLGLRLDFGSQSLVCPVLTREFGRY